MHENRIELMQYRLDFAEEKLESARLLLSNGNLKDSVSRSYYAIFTCVRALLAVDGIDFSKHSAVIAYFQKEYIKTEIFDVKYSKYLSQAFQIRNNVDYADFYIVSEEEAKEQFARAQEFYEVIKEYLLRKIS